MLGWLDSLIAAAKQARSAAEPLMLGLLLALAVTAAAWGILTLLRALFRRARGYLNSSRTRAIRPITLKGVELFSRARIIDAIETLLGLVEGLGITVLAFLYVSLLLRCFAATRTASRTLIGHALAALSSVGTAALSYLPKLAFIAVILIVIRYLLKLLAFIFGLVERGTLVFEGFHPEWAKPTFKLLRAFVLILTLIAIFPYLPGFNSPAFKGVSVAIGLLLSLGSSSAIANVIAGLVLTYMRPFKAGDRVQIAATTGDVIEKSLLVTRVRTIKNEEVTIANSLVLGSHIVNYSASAQEEGLILHTNVTIGYDAAWRKVHDLLIAAARQTPLIRERPAPFVLQLSLDDSFVTYQLNAFTDRPSEMAGIYAKLHENIQDRFAEAGVEILSPHYAALRNGNRPAAPRRAA
ncbi:MAG: mechanosensitive ion channel [Elusimicrobia bacterium]|nr:mechanosensitive ion channel [Elusimicrobiota bacterium]MDE2426813.1 mechanosensitive ion channel [Elusimicrobiota bacterium]